MSGQTLTLYFVPPILVSYAEMLSRISNNLWAPKIHIWACTCESYFKLEITLWHFKTWNWNIIIFCGKDKYYIHNSSEFQFQVNTCRIYDSLKVKHGDHSKGYQTFYKQPAISRNIDWHLIFKSLLRPIMPVGLNAKHAQCTSGHQYQNWQNITMLTMVLVFLLPTQLCRLIVTFWPSALMKPWPSAAPKCAMGVFLFIQDNFGV